MAALCRCEHQAARSKSPSAAVCSSIAATWQLLKKKERGNYLAQISILCNIAVRSGHYGKMMLQANAWSSCTVKAADWRQRDETKCIDSGLNPGWKRHWATQSQKHITDETPWADLLVEYKKMSFWYVIVLHLRSSLCWGTHFTFDEYTFHFHLQFQFSSASDRWWVWWI